MPRIVCLSFSPKRQQRGEGGAAINYPPSAIDSLRLLNYFFKLCAEHIDASIGIKIPAKRNVKPVSLFTFHSKFVGIRYAASSRSITSGLRNHIDKKVPSPSLYPSPPEHARPCSWSRQTRQAGDGIEARLRKSTGDRPR